MDPVTLPSNRPKDRFYRGGAAIAAFRGEQDLGSHTPEDWVASTTSVRGRYPEGQTRLPDGELLTDAVAADPVAWLGEGHVAAFGVDTKLLVKLLDAGQRLPVHAHPDGAFAARFVAASHGKAEAWYILSPGEVYLGLRDDVSRSELARLVTEQSTEELLALLHRIPVEPGDSVYVPPGVLHAIGAGVLLAEVQEPEDLSILLEWSGFDLDGAVDGHLGLGFDLALEAVEVHGRTVEEIQGLVHRATAATGLLPESAQPYFRLDLAGADVASSTFEAGFAVIIALEHAVDVRFEAAGEQTLPAGSTTVVPARVGTFTIAAGAALVARPPAW